MAFDKTWNRHAARRRLVHSRSMSFSRSYVLPVLQLYCHIFTLLCSNAFCNDSFLLILLFFCLIEYMFANVFSSFLFYFILCTCEIRSQQQHVVRLKLQTYVAITIFEVLGLPLTLNDSRSGCAFVSTCHKLLYLFLITIV